MKIVVMGSYNSDMIVKVPHIPKPGETVLGGKFSTAAGGKGAVSYTHLTLPTILLL